MNTEYTQAHTPLAVRERTTHTALENQPVYAGAKVRADRTDDVGVNRKRVLACGSPERGTSPWEPPAYKIMVCFTPLELMKWVYFHLKYWKG